MRKKEECVPKTRTPQIHSFLRKVKIMDLNKILFPYYKNVPDKNGNLKVVKEWVTYEDYVNNLHYNPITRLPC